MKLVLSKVAKKHPPSLGGQYVLGNGLTNNKNYWVHRSGHSAIWWNDQGWFWCVGTYEKLGENFAGIVGPFNQKGWPISITEGWNYFNGIEWTDAASEDVKFLDWSSVKGKGNSCENKALTDCLYSRISTSSKIKLATQRRT